MGSEELAANLFRATQAEAKIKREWTYGQQKANQAHLEVGGEIRQMIRKIGGTMPENLPTPDWVNKAETRLKKSRIVKKLK
jgi:DNA-damage-inducible protein D